MCGIAGIKGKVLSSDELSGVLGSIRHRGPDFEDSYQDDDVSLVHTRLSIIDTSDAANQPMLDPETGVCIVYNGEIYNYRELRDTLAPEKLRSHSDTEVILRLYLEEGLDSVAKLRGMFAFAIWDPRSGELHLVRDRFGIKPLCYHHDGGVLAFGSEAKALFALGAPQELNLTTVFDYLRHGLLAHTPETFFKNVQNLSPGTTLTFRDGEISENRYWSPYDAVEEVEPEGDVENDLWQTFVEDMRLHLVSDVPVGVTLSSGLDSQFLLHLLAATGVKEVDAFSYGFDEAEYDEVRRIDEMQFPLAVKRHNLRMTPDDVLEHLRRAVRIFEVPIGGLGTLGVYRIMEVARKEGIKVLLAGEGSDEMFAGYRYYHDAYFRDLNEAGDSGALEKELAGYSSIQGEALEAGSEAFANRMAGSTDKVMAPDGSAVAPVEFLGPALKNLDPAESWRRSREWHQQPQDGTSNLRRAMLRDLHVQKIPKLLAFQDRAAMAWGVETRVPFLDHVMFAFMRRLPARWLIRDGAAKYLLKRLYERFCNLDYSNVRKHFVSTPQREWIKGPLFDTIMNLVDGGRLSSLGLIDFAAFEKAYTDYANAPELGNSFFVWKVINLELLLQEFFPENA